MLKLFRWPLLLLLAGLFFRVFYPGNVSLGFDQVQILQKAEEISQGNLTLIGPRTGPATMFTGPLIYYLTVPVFMVFGTWSVVIVPLLLAAVTGGALYWLFSHYRTSEEAVLALGLWAFSPFLVSLDRVFWNPDLTLLASLCLFLPLTVLPKKLDRVDWVLLASGAFLAYQAHFSGLIAVGLTGFWLLWKRQGKAVVAMVSGIVTSLLPTFLFDLKNNWLNTRGLVELISGKGNSQLGKWLWDLGHNGYIVAETLGKLMFYHNSTTLLVVAGLLLLMLLWKWRQRFDSFLLVSFWLISVIIVYSFYKETKPEYYFLITMPALFLGVTWLFQQLDTQTQKLIIIFYIVLSTVTNIQLVSHHPGLTLGSLQQIHQHLRESQVKEIMADVPYGSSDGLEYFLQDIPHQEAGTVYHVIYPNDYTFPGVVNFNGVGLWADSRSQTKNNLTDHDFILSVATGYQLYRNDYPQASTADVIQYQLFQDQIPLGIVRIAPESRYQALPLSDINIAMADTKSDWLTITDQEFVRCFDRYCAQIQLNDQTIVTALELDIK